MFPNTFFHHPMVLHQVPVRDVYRYLKTLSGRQNRLQIQNFIIQKQIKMDSTKIPITKNVLDTSIHYICTNNLKLSSCLRLSNNITPEQDPPVFNNIVFHHNILSSGFHLAGDSPNPFFYLCRGLSTH